MPLSIFTMVWNISIGLQRTILSTSTGELSRNRSNRILWSVAFSWVGALFPFHFFQMSELNE